MTKLQGLIFDLDGTLVNSAPDIRQVLNKTLVKEGRRPVTLNEVTELVGDGLFVTLKRAFQITGEALNDDKAYSLMQKFVQDYRAQKGDPSQIYPHVEEALERYVQAGMKLGLCTNKQEQATIKLLDDLNLTRFFTFIAGGDTFMYHKPHPDHVKGVIEKLGIPASGCVMVGDSSNDVRAAQGAGIPCIVVTQGYGGDFENLAANVLIKDFGELDEALRNLGFS